MTTLTTSAPGMILTLNGGSSSIKFALFAASDLTRILAGKIERIGQADAQFEAREAASGHMHSFALGQADFSAAGKALLKFLDDHCASTPLALAHRVVHGGAEFHAPHRVTPGMLEKLRALSSFDPEHLPAEIALMEAARAHYPNAVQIACFDTAFHHTLPRVAQILPIPRRFDAQGVRRYGFHGISYSYLMEELARVAGTKAARGRIVLAHLGNGSSLAAVKGGKSIDTTMGFTPTAGVVMGTRSGDLDPGLVWYLAQMEGQTASQFHAMVNKQSGLLGISETSADMRDLQKRSGSDVRAAEAIELYCYQIKKTIGAYSAALGGLETVVFAGGIGENSPEIRARICADLQCLGIELDAAQNQANAALISSAASRVAVRVIRTDEEVQLARAAQRLLGEPKSAP